MIIKIIIVCLILVGIFLGVLIFIEPDTKTCFNNENYGCVEQDDGVIVCDRREEICFRELKGFIREKLEGCSK